jgi:Fe-S-cluster-containing hydrogenase component 2
MTADSGNGIAKDTTTQVEPQNDNLVTRRSFVKVAAVCTVGGLAFSSSVMESIAGVTDDVSSFDVLNLLPGSAMGHIARVSIDESACASCGMCILVCAATHGNEIGWSSSGIWLDRHPFQCVYDTVACRQCNAPDCYFSCHAEGGEAIFIDARTGARAIDASKCIGCGKCMDACVFSPPRITLDSERNIAVKCDLCSGRPEGPACVEFCPHQALTLERGV